MEKTNKQKKKKPNKKKKHRKIKICELEAMRFFLVLRMIIEYILSLLLGYP